jgi:hypothetical protein
MVGEIGGSAEEEADQAGDWLHSRSNRSSRTAYGPCRRNHQRIERNGPG